MRRFIRYLYEYEQGKRMRNVGFVKVEQGEDECFLNIHGKGLRMSGDSSLQIYLIYEENGDCVGVWQREADNVNPALNETLHCTREDAGEEENFEKINGVLLEHADGRRYAAVWDETPMNISGMRRWMPPDSGKGGAARQGSLPDETTDRREEIPGAPEEERKMPGVREEEREMPGMPEEERGLPGMQEEEQIPLLRGEDLGALKGGETDRAQEPVLGEEAAPEAQEAAPGEEAAPETAEAWNPRRAVKTWRIRKIQRSEISKLARCEWRLANNNFLLHGYYNYHHLVLLESSERLMLGVPGIYHEKEAAAAGAFGFAEFIARESLEIKLSPEECNEEYQFGYWCRPVKHSFNWE